MKTKSIHFLDILEYVPDSKKNQFITDLVVYVPHIQAEAEKYKNIVHDVNFGKERTEYINSMRKTSKEIWNSDDTSRRDLKNIQSRQMLYYFLYNTLPLSYAEVGGYFDKDHSTVIHGIKRFTSDMETSLRTRLMVEFFVTKMEENGYRQPRRAYELLMNKIEVYGNNNQ